MEFDMSALANTNVSVIRTRSDRLEQLNNTIKVLGLDVETAERNLLWSLGFGGRARDFCGFSFLPVLCAPNERRLIGPQREQSEVIFTCHSRAERNLRTAH